MMLGVRMSCVKEGKSMKRRAAGKKTNSLNVEERRDGDVSLGQNKGRPLK